LAPTPKVVDNPDERRFEIHVGDELAGFSVYELQDGGATYAFSHTETDERFQGQGLASILVKEALDQVKAKGAAVLPYCPFMRAWIRRHPAYVELVPERDRAYFKVDQPEQPG
jgi:predicted GNAT family acetyltransferase